MYIYIQLTIHKCLFSHTYTLNVAVKIVLKRQQHMFPLEKFYRGEIFTKTSDQPNQQKKEIPIHPHWVCLCRDTASSFACDVCHKREIWKNHDFLFECKNDKTICAFFTSLSLFFFDSQIFALLTSWNNCVNAVFFCYNWNISCKLVYLFIFRFFYF